GLTFLGKYWAIYLAVGMAITSLIGSGTRSFWRSPVPYLMGLSASLVVAPHVYCFVTDRSQATQDFMEASVLVAQPFGTALIASISYLSVSAAAVLAAPYVAHLRVTSNAELHERHYRHVAEQVLRLSNSDQSIAGTREIVQGLFFYLPEARPIALPSSTDSTALAAVRAN